MIKTKLKKLITIMAVVILTINGFTGCTDTKKTGLESFSSRPKKVTVVYTANSYGKEWITQIAKEYMTNYNSDTYINTQQTVRPSEEFSKILTDSSSGDLYLFDQHLGDAKNNVIDLQDVWDSYAYGEETMPNAKKIKDKLNSLLKSYTDPEGTKDFSIPYSQGTTYGFVYNKTVLDEAFPNGYTLPRTTDELFEMGNALKGVDLKGVSSTQDVYLMSMSLADSNENLRYAQQTWLYHLLGYEKAEKFYDGKFWDDNQSKYVFDETAPTVLTKYEKEIKEFYRILEKLGTKANGYVYNDADSMDYIYSSGALSGAGFKANKSKAVFKVDGPYFEKESAMFLESLKSRGNEQVIGMMSFPIASGIIERLSTVNDDAKLREVISYVDGVTTTKPSGVSDEDIKEVREARGMTPMYLGGGMLIPNTSNNKDGAKDFIRFLCSDQAQIISAKALNGLEILPYGKVVSEEELGFKRSNFLSTVSNWQTKNTTLASGRELFTIYGEFGLGDNSSSLIYTIFGGRFVGVDSWYTTAYNTYNANWSDRVKNYKGHGGQTD